MQKHSEQLFWKEKSNHILFAMQDPGQRHRCSAQSCLNFHITETDTGRSESQNETHTAKTGLSRVRTHPGAAFGHFTHRPGLFLPVLGENHPTPEPG